MGTNTLHEDHEASGRFNPFCSACLKATGPVNLDRRDESLQNRLWSEVDKASRRLITPLSQLALDR